MYKKRKTPTLSNETDNSNENIQDLATESNLDYTTKQQQFGERVDSTRLHRKDTNNHEESV